MIHRLYAFLRDIVLLLILSGFEYIVRELLIGKETVKYHPDVSIFMHPVRHTIKVPMLNRWYECGWYMLTFWLQRFVFDDRYYLHSWVKTDIYDKLKGKLCLKCYEWTEGFVQLKLLLAAGLIVPLINVKAIYFSHSL